MVRIKFIFLFSEVLKHGKNHSGHGWIELDNYVYDPTHLMRFDKDLYYKMFCPTKVKKYSTKDYMKNNKELYEDIKNNAVTTTLNEENTSKVKNFGMENISMPQFPIPAAETTF